MRALIAVTAFAAAIALPAWVMPGPAVWVGAIIAAYLLLGAWTMHDDAEPMP